MKHSKILSSLLIALTLGGSLSVRAQEDVPPPPKPGGIFGPPERPADPLLPQNQPQDPLLGPDVKDALADDFDIQTRGPIHEAYAEIYEPNPKPGLLINKQPPKAIEEVPPEIKPEGQDILWISGYWAWDDENEDFMWVSGIWRKPPPGLEWAPGYWAQVEGGYRWVSGFWAKPGDNIVYREPPPESRDQQLLLDQGADDQFWIPGSWDYQNDQYAWTDGYYAPYQQNWCWVPVRWRWTPRGYIRLAGYWDYRPTVRAMLFAPVVFRPGVVLRPRFFFTPRIVVDPWIAMNHFWIRPGYNHYYFGNYYGGNYGRYGFTPYASYFRTGGHWDPIFCYYQSYYRRQGINFHTRLDSYNNYFMTHANVRPPLDWDAQRRFAHDHRDSDFLRTSIITSPLETFATSANARVPLVAIDDRVRIALGQADSRMNQQLLAHRELAERAKRDGDAAGKASDLVNWSMPKLDRQLDAKDLRLAGSKLDSAVRRDLDGRPVNRKVDPVPRRNEPKVEKQVDRSPPNVPRRDANPLVGDSPKKSPTQSEADLIRERFGNDPIRFQQEMDKLWSRRAGEQPSISPRTRPITPDKDSGSSLQGSGRAGGLGSPDFRLLPRSGGGGDSGSNSAPRRDDRKPFSGGPPAARSLPGTGVANGNLAPKTEVRKPISGGDRTGRSLFGGGNSSGGNNAAQRELRKPFSGENSGVGSNLGVGASPRNQEVKNIAPMGNAFKGNGPILGGNNPARSAPSKIGNSSPSGPIGGNRGAGGRGGKR